MVNDYAGHPFQIQLSRSLALGGHEVLHTYFANNNTPKGRMERQADDPFNFHIEPVSVDTEFKKYAPLARRQADVAVGRTAGEYLRRFRPEVVLSANMPLDGQRVLLHAARATNARFVFWLQDVLSAGIEFVLRKKRIPGAAVISRYYARMERKLLRDSDAIVCIAPEFGRLLASWRIDRGKTFVIENWAPLDEVRPMSRNNPWSRAFGIADKFCFLYSGTLGMKHRPDLLLALAKHFRTRSDVVIAVVAQGAGADWLRDHADEAGPRLLLLPFQPYERLPEVLSSASVLITILDAECGAFAVPSKSLAYLCAGRAQLLVAPCTNLASTTVERAGAGVVIADDSAPNFVHAASQMLDDAHALQCYGANARAYAERTFNISRIAQQFLDVFRSCGPRNFACTAGMASRPTSLGPPSSI
jgi:glycosyltransferase involved in cell wall biosynthesis